MKRILRSPVFIPMIAWFLLLGILDQIANNDSLFWILPGFDKLLHLIGGGAVGMVMVICIGAFNPHISKKKKFWLVIGAAFGIGVCVELGEVVLNNLSIHPLPFDSFDTATDLIFDILGGVITFLYYYL